MFADFFLNLIYKWKLKKAVKERELEDELVKHFCEHQWAYIGKEVAYYDFAHDPVYNYLVYCPSCDKRKFFRQYNQAENQVKMSLLKKQNVER